jgi:deazaflavin-dependent oxidoreductase (nitroreductase family)
MTQLQYLHGKEHVERYLATDGEEGYYWRNGTTILLLFTKGRRSGEKRISPLIYRDWAKDAYLIVASKGGSPEPPDWYLNLKADPDVEVQIRGERFAVRARDAGPDEKADMWKHMVDVWPAYEDYQRKTDREIPVVVLERTELL